MDIGELIYNRRKELNLTLEEVGNYVGVSKSTVKKWESGFISNMRRDKIALLAKILKIEPTELIGDGKTGNTPQEEALLSNYRQLNPEGQKKVEDYAEDLVKCGGYSNTETKTIAAFGGAETVTVNKKELNEAVEKLLKDKGLI